MNRWEVWAADGRFGGHRTYLVMTDERHAAGRPRMLAMPISDVTRPTTLHMGVTSEIGVPLGTAQIMQIGEVSRSVFKERVAVLARASRDDVRDRLRLVLDL